MLSRTTIGALGLARTGVLAGRLGTAAIASPALYLAAASRGFASTSSTSSRLPPTVFQSRRPTPNSNDTNNSKSPSVILSQTRNKWSYAENGFLNPVWAKNHPWIAGCSRLAISFTLGLTILLGAILLHDMSTYNERHVDRVPCNPLSLHPRKGGPKNLPIIEENLDDAEDDEKKAMSGKPRLVIVGGGWGAVAVLKTLPTSYYNVTVIAPENYFVFTPLLPSACVGTVEPRSLVEPLRRLIARVRGHYLHGSAVDIDMANRLVEVEIPSQTGGEATRAYVPYDKVVVAVGSRSNDHGVKGLDNCYQLKRIPDAQAIRRKIMSNLEAATLPTTTPEERKVLLSFVVCGGGPTGVEFAAELSDMLNEDVLDFYPKTLKNEVTVSIVQSRDHILNTYSEKISNYAEQRFGRTDVKVITNARVAEVTPNSVILTIKNDDGKTETKEIPSGFTLWSTGIAMQPFTQRMTEQLPNQFHSKAVQVDAHLRVEGSPKGTVYAIGDASTIHLDILNNLLVLWEKFDANKDDKLDRDEWQLLAKHLKKKFPLAETSLEEIGDIFKKYDKDNDGNLSLNEVAEMFLGITKNLTTLPATAQVASQQGEYLGHMFSKLANEYETLKANGIENVDDEAYYSPFKYHHLGSLAYIGNSAVFDYYGYSIAGGLLGMYAWRSVYWGEQTSWRTRFMLMLDWIKRGIFGRDLSKF